MAAKVLMFQGTGSDVGKSTLVAGLCRIATQRGLKVAPFKPQNMSNNAAACVDGGEIGRAQALQARAANLEPCVHFNPVLLKPQSDRTAQIVVHGKSLSTVSASEYMNDKRASLMDSVVESFQYLCENYDLVLVEGAGSASEINLRERDIANMGFARKVNAPVCLIGDIDRGGVIASVVGTKTVIAADDASLISSFIINRFRGDPRLFDDGVSAIEQLSGWPCRGVVPWLPSALKLPQEDSVLLTIDEDVTTVSNGRIRIAVPMLSRIANFDDMDPLRLEPNVDLGFVPPGQVIPQDVDVIIIPGSKSVMGDLAFMREQGWDHDIVAFARNGGRVLGLCGGYQLLGQTIHDPSGVDGHPGSAAALGLLEITTEMFPDKKTRLTKGKCSRSHHAISAYEIHAGTTKGPDTQRPMALLDGHPEGAINVTGNVEGTYLHGLFSNDAFRGWWLNTISQSASSSLNFEQTIENELNRLADGLQNSLDIDALFNDAKEPDVVS